MALDLSPELARQADPVDAVGHPKRYLDLVHVLREQRLYAREGWDLTTLRSWRAGWGSVVATLWKPDWALACTGGPV